MGARSYAPDLAVWASPDPALLELPERGLHAAFALGNAYGYAGGAPVHAVDRDGHWAVVVMAAIVVGVLLTCQYANAPESKSAPTFHKDDGDLALDMAHNSAIAYGVMSTAGGAVATAGEAGVGVAVVRTGSTVAQGAVAGTAVHGIADQVDPSGRVGKVADIAMVVQSAVPSKGIGARVGPATVAPEAPRTGTAGGPRAGKDFTVAGRRNVWKDNTTARGAPTCEGCERSVSKPLQSKKGITPPGDEGHVDHIVAKSKGGDGSPSNGALLCRDCNLKKSNK
jgi:RHS repeat-associated protein